MLMVRGRCNILVVTVVATMLAADTASRAAAAPVHRLPAPTQPGKWVDRLEASLRRSMPTVRIVREQCAVEGTIEPARLAPPIDRMPPRLSQVREPLLNLPPPTI